MVVSWLKYDWENRRPHAHRLFQHVRLGRVPGKQLQRLVDADICKIPECNQLLVMVEKLQRSGLSDRHLAWKRPDLFATRSSITVSYENFLLLFLFDSMLEVQCTDIFL